MSRLRRKPLAASTSFPRVSGDEPAAVSIALAGAEFSPRERG